MKKQNSGEEARRRPPVWHSGLVSASCFVGGSPDWGWAQQGGAERHAIQTSFGAFWSYCQVQDTISLDYPGLVVGDIDKFVALGTALVFFDRMSDSLYYVDLDAGKWKTLTVEDSLPGHDLWVAGIQRLDETSFVVSTPLITMYCLKGTASGEWFEPKGLGPATSLQQERAALPSGTTHAQRSYGWPSWRSRVDAGARRGGSMRSLRVCAI